RLPRDHLGPDQRASRGRPRSPASPPSHTSSWCSSWPPGAAIGLTRTVVPLRATWSSEAFKPASHLVFCGLRGEPYGTLWHAALEPQPNNLEESRRYPLT